MVRAGSGDPKHAARNQKERERYQIVSNTIEELKKKLKLNARCHTQVLSETLDQLRKLKTENQVKIVERNKIMAEIGLPSFSRLPPIQMPQFQLSSQFPALQNLPGSRIIPSYSNPYGPFPFPYGNPMLLAAGYGNQAPRIPFYQPQLPPQFTQQFKSNGGGSNLPKL